MYVVIFMGSLRRQEEEKKRNGTERKAKHGTIRGKIKRISMRKEERKGKWKKANIMD